MAHTPGRIDWEKKKEKEREALAKARMAARNPMKKLESSASPVQKQQPTLPSAPSAERPSKKTVWSGGSLRHTPQRPSHVTCHRAEKFRILRAES